MTGGIRTQIFVTQRAVLAWMALPIWLFGLLLLPGMIGVVHAQSENLLNRISDKRMQAYEAGLTESLNAMMARYVSRHQYIVAVKVIWNPDIVPLIENPELTPEQQKLPGFPIFVKSPEAPVAEESTPPFTRLEVKVLIDETLPEYYERFVRKLVPIAARFDFNRGDQVVVLKETFPQAPANEEPPPTLPEKELMQQLGQTVAPGVVPQGGGMGGGMTAGMMGMPMPQQQMQPGMPQQQMQPGASPSGAAQMAFDEGRLADALRIVQGAFQQATNNKDRAYFLGMEGSVYYAMNNTQAAVAAWKRAISFDPGNLEVHEALNYVETNPSNGAAK